MTLEEKANLLLFCRRIKANSGRITVRENFNNTGFKAYSLTELPAEIAINYAVNFIEKRIEALVYDPTEEIKETK